MANGSSMMKEFHRLVRHVDKLYDGQVELELNDEVEDMDELTFSMTITPNDGLYKNAECRFQVTADVNNPPHVICLNNIYHPNIDIKDHNTAANGGEICVNLLGEDWEPEVGLDGCVQAVLFLFYNPQLDDALNPLFGNLAWEEFEENLYIALRGGEIDSVKFDKLITEEDQPTNKDEGELNGSNADAVQDTNNNDVENGHGNEHRTQCAIHDDVQETNESEDGTRCERDESEVGHQSETGESNDQVTSENELDSLIQDTTCETQEQELIQNQIYFFSNSETMQENSLLRQRSTDGRKQSIFKTWFMKIKAGISLFRTKWVI